MQNRKIVCTSALTLKLHWCIFDPSQRSTAATQDWRSRQIDRSLKSLKKDPDARWPLSSGNNMKGSRLP